MENARSYDRSRDESFLKEKLIFYVGLFNSLDQEYYPTLISNDDAEAFLGEQIPLFECPDIELEYTYYFRWWTFRKHFQETPHGHIVTEFLPKVPWSGPYNSIVCPAGFHIREGRWLKDPDGWIKEYIRFWMNGHGNAFDYSCWLPHAIWEYCSQKQDWEFAGTLLHQMVAFFDKREEKHRRSCGLYWSEDNRDGMEYSISGSGLRPTMNAYAYGDALAISRIAGKMGDEKLSSRYAKKADEIRTAVNRYLWNGAYYKTIPLDEGHDPVMEKRPELLPDTSVRELIGYIPWYFNLPEMGREAGFSELKNTEGFWTIHGLTTAEQRHPRFMEAHDHECLWNGPIWPFATSQVLVAVSNLLRNYDQAVLDSTDYYSLLRQYAMSHRMTRDTGEMVPWIDENIDPVTGTWLARSILEEWGWKPDLGGYERGKDYNHSLFCDLVLSGLLGIRAEGDVLTAEPLIPEEWNWFCVENLWHQGQPYRITFDRDGSRYHNGPGLRISVVT